MTEEKFYLTKEGLEKFKREYKELKALRDAKTTGESPKIFHSEEINPEYLAFQEDLLFLENRLSELEKVIRNVQLIKNPPPKEQNVVKMGATVSIEADGEEDEFTLVGPLEADPSLGKISNESPVGRALLGMSKGQDVTVPSPIKTVYKIKRIKYKKA